MSVIAGDNFDLAKFIKRNFSMKWVFSGFPMYVQKGGGRKAGGGGKKKL